MEVLQSTNDNTHWEAAKALGEIRDPQAAPGLVDTLEDRESAVRWLAAKGLIALARWVLIPLLEALESESDSIWMREGARHVIHSLV
jgi:HEAT repeat protein